jgi:hypothetical protein
LMTAYVLSKIAKINKLNTRINHTSAQHTLKVL